MKTYRIKIDKTNKKHKLSAISLVNDPASKEVFNAFSKQKSVKTIDEKMQMVGAILVPNSPMERFDENIGAYNVVFDEQSIEDAVHSARGDFSGLNIEHSLGVENGEAYVTEVWIKESENDKSSNYDMEHLPIGTAFARIQVKDESIWNSVKEREINGLSPELVSDLEEVAQEFSAQNTEAELLKQIIALHKELKD